MASENTIINMDYHYEEFNSSKRPKLISKVWEDMQRIQTSEGSKVQCGHCGKLLQDNCGTSHLKRHLDICPKNPRPPSAGILGIGNGASKTTKQCYSRIMSSAGILGTGNDKGAQA